jgi:hypothetical protein
MKQIYLVLFGAAILIGCADPEKAQLKTQIDSLNYIVEQNREATATLDEVGILLDSIDASRRDMSLNIIEGMTYADYISRLKKINANIKASEAKIAALESNMKKSRNISESTIKRLKGNLDARSSEIVGLQMEVTSLRLDKNSQYTKLLKKDSIISSKDEVIRLQSESVLSLQNMVKGIDDENRHKVAALYFNQAQALETAADRTQFAPRKKNEARREALELYRLSLSLGNIDAQERIDKLEKELS